MNDTLSSNRKLSVILAADAAGYSRLMAADEAGTITALNEARAIFRRHTENRGGRVVDTAGDSVLAEFSSPIEAVSAASTIQQELAKLYAELPEERRMRFRIGINLGDLIEDKGAIYGDGVNVAAGLQELSAPGGLCISGTVFDQIEGRLPMAFKSIGEQQVKNIPNPVHAFLIDMHGDKNAAPRPGGKTAGAGRTAALLPVLGAASAVVVAIGAFAVWQGKTPPAPAVPQQTAAATAPPAKKRHSCNKPVGGGT